MATLVDILLAPVPVTQGTDIFLYDPTQIQPSALSTDGGGGKRLGEYGQWAQLFLARKKQQEEDKAKQRQLIRQQEIDDLLLIDDNFYLVESLT